MATKLRHQSATGSIPQSPSNHFLEGRTNTAVCVDIVTRNVTVLLGIDRLVLDQLLPLGNLLGVLQPVFAGGSWVIEVLFELSQLVTNLVEGAIRCLLTAWNRQRLGIFSWCIVSVPLGSNMVDLSEQAPADQVDRVVIELSLIHI